MKVKDNIQQTLPPKSSQKAKKAKSSIAIVPKKFRQRLVNLQAVSHSSPSSCVLPFEALELNDG